MAIRGQLRLPPARISNRQIEVLFKALDKDGGGELELREFTNFLVEGPEALGGALDQSMEDQAKEDEIAALHKK